MPSFLFPEKSPTASERAFQALTSAALIVVIKCKSVMRRRRCRRRRLFLLLLLLYECYFDINKIHLLGKVINVVPLSLWSEVSSDVTEEIGVITILFLLLGVVFITISQWFSSHRKEEEGLVLKQDSASTSYSISTWQSSQNITDRGVKLTFYMLQINKGIYW